MGRLVDSGEVERNIRLALDDMASRDDETIFNCISRGINRTAAVVVQSKRGHWNLYVNKGSIDVACSECGHGSEALGDDKYESLCCFATRYCPECGALMSHDEE